MNSTKIFLVYLIKSYFNIIYQYIKKIKLLSFECQSLLMGKILLTMTFQRSKCIGVHF